VVSLVLSAVLGYLLGSFPTAYVLVRWNAKIDIREAGSGNVGTLNSFQVTNSKLVGAVVLVVDVLKGVVAVVVARMLFGGEFSPPALAGISAVLGHNAPVWLKFKGGRGLATAAGVMFVVGWILVAVWGACWVAGYATWRRVNLGNAFALLVLLLLILLLPLEQMQPFLSAWVPAGAFRYFGAVLLGIILMRHVEPVRVYIEEKRFHDTGKEGISDGRNE
jgi:acyl phosphate:glycerol-3-phosphate acyltransferase